MKSRILKIWSLTMVLVFAASTSGISINRHFCGGKEKSKAFILQADKCAFESKSICRKHDTATLTKKACCSDHSVYYKQHFQADNDFQFLEVDFDFDYTSLLVNHKNVVIDDHEGELIPVYRPPPLKEYLFIIHQSFLL